MVMFLASEGGVIGIIFANAAEDKQHTSHGVANVLRVFPCTLSPINCISVATYYTKLSAAVFAAE